MLADILARYLEIFPGERQKLELLRRQIKANEILNDRRNFTGHITASTIILSPDKRRVLLIHHKAYDRWQQPGGHWDPTEANPLEAARRESIEETGLKLGENIPLDPKNTLVPFDIDTHQVPPRVDKDEPSHFHHDFLYVFTAPDIRPQRQITEVKAAGWFNFEAPEIANIKKYIPKLRRHKIIR